MGDDVAEGIDSAGFAESRRDRVVEPRQARCVHLVDLRQRHLRERLLGRLLDRLQQALFTRGDEADRIAGATGAAGAADAVHVRLGVDRQIVVDDVADALDVEAASGDVGGDEDVELAVLQRLHRAFALRLLDVAVDGGGGVAASAQLLGDLLGVTSRAGEDDHAVEVLDLENAGQRVELLRVRDDVVALRDAGARLRLALDLDLAGVVQVLLRDATDGGGHGRREEGDLLLLRGVGENRLDVLCEAHLEHLVGLVEHEVLDLRQVERTALEVIHDAAGGADDDVHAATQRGELLTVGLAAVDGEEVDFGQVRGVALERLADLEREFTSRCEYEGLGNALAGGDTGEDRKCEGSGLAGAGLREADHVCSLEERGDRGGLDCRGRFVSHIRHCAENLGRKAQVGEGRALALGFGGGGVFGRGHHTILPRFLVAGVTPSYRHATGAEPPPSIHPIRTGAHRCTPPRPGPAENPGARTGRSYTI